MILLNWANIIKKFLKNKWLETKNPPEVGGFNILHYIEVKIVNKTKRMAFVNWIPFTHFLLISTSFMSSGHLRPDVSNLSPFKQAIAKGTLSIAAKKVITVILGRYL